ncbi:paeninodin family lasso peptide [Bacillus suaedae]|uniref:Paeninodin family lasso peptide n=1 Tax=Halalkalibacter suaedae TaxID=2822140 RepID=A0A940X036_9BACI|nr:paeninodin family lasso peptide [Bacillus suaedae]MBP3951504.1 paeninodin family lasso peptide [Bacillus suaedae]
MKKHWEKPVLEVLEINMTMSNPHSGNNLDQTYEDGTPRDQLTWS